MKSTSSIEGGREHIQGVKTDCCGPFLAPQHTHAWEGSADMGSRSANVWSILLAWAMCHPSSIQVLRTASENSGALSVRHCMRTSKGHQTRPYATGAWDQLRSLSPADRATAG